MVLCNFKNVHCARRDGHPLGAIADTRQMSLVGLLAIAFFWVRIKMTVVYLQEINPNIVVKYVDAEVYIFDLVCFGLSTDYCDSECLLYHSPLCNSRWQSILLCYSFYTALTSNANGALLVCNSQVCGGVYGNELLLVSISR